MIIIGGMSAFNQLHAILEMISVKYLHAGKKPCLTDAMFLLHYPLSFYLLLPNQIYYILFCVSLTLHFTDHF